MDGLLRRHIVYFVAPHASFTDEIEHKAQAETRMTTLSRGMGRILRHSQLFLLLRERLRPIPEEPPPDLLEPVFTALQTGSHHEYLRMLHAPGESWERVRTGMTELARLSSNAANIPVLVMLFPTECSEGYEHYPLWDVHARVISEVDRKGLHAFDLTWCFGLAQRDFDNKCFIELLHPNAWGYKVTASCLLSWLIGSGVLPKGSFDLDSVLADRNLDPLVADILRNGRQPR